MHEKESAELEEHGEFDHGTELVKNGTDHAEAQNMHAGKTDRTNWQVATLVPAAVGNARTRCTAALHFVAVRDEARAQTNAAKGRADVRCADTVHADSDPDFQTHLQKDSTDSTTQTDIPNDFPYRSGDVVQGWGDIGLEVAMVLWC